ncbi:MAG: HAMP domain-containing protein [Chloroflexi bacterium]|nr:MAG: HAMP domain-containing protein [Chloroflexota bacterium]
MSWRPRGIAARIGTGIAILALGVVIVGGERFTALMVGHGESPESSEAMFRESVFTVVIVAVIVAVFAALALAMVLGSRLASPLHAVGLAARRVARGDYAARIPRAGPEEIASLADSFNRERGTRAAYATHEPEGVPRGPPGWGDRAGPGDAGLPVGRGRAARAALSLARHAGLRRH